MVPRTHQRVETESQALLSLAEKKSMKSASMLFPRNNRPGQI